MILGVLACGHLHAQKPGIQLELLVPISTPGGERVIALDRYPRLHASLTNVSEQPVKVWKDWNSWGWFNLTLIMESDRGTQAIRRKHPTHWEGDFSDFWVILPGETLILEIDMTDGSWAGFPDLYGERLPATLTAVYENKADVLAEEFGIWVGKVTASSLRVVFE